VLMAVRDVADGVMYDQLDDPDAERTKAFENRADDGGGDVRDEHSRDVVREDDENVQNDEDNQNGVVPHHDESVDSVLVNAVSFFARKLLDDRHEDRAHDDSAPHALEAHNEDGRGGNVVHKEVLENDLRSLNELRANDKADGHDNLALGDASLTDASGGNCGDTDNCESDNNKKNGKPHERIVGTMEDERAEKRGEQNHGATEHLPNGRLDVKKTNIH